MPRIVAAEVVKRIVAEGLVPVFSNADPKINVSVAQACLRAGSTLFEFTNRVPNAVEVFRATREGLCGNVDQILGVGTIHSADDADAFISAGADFIVGPVFDAEVSRVCRERGVPYSPGCMTPTEIHNALASIGPSGIVKVFPGDCAGGPKFVSAVRATRPGVRIMPTGGVEPSESGLKAWFEAGVVAVGIGSKLITASAITDSDWQSIEIAVRQVLETIKRVKA